MYRNIVDKMKTTCTNKNVYENSETEISCDKFQKLFYFLFSRKDNLYARFFTISHYDNRWYNNMNHMIGEVTCILDYII